MPAFHLLFQAMIFSALLESGTSSVHAINERIDHAWQARRGRPLSHRARLTIALVLLVGCMFLASRFGLVALIATGYRALAYVSARDLHPAAGHRRRLAAAALVSARRRTAAQTRIDALEA